MKNSLFIFALLLFTACQQNKGEQQQISELASALAAAQQEIADLKKKENIALTHLVYLDLKEDISQEGKEKLVAAIHKLAEIPVVKNLRLGSFKNINDPRALSEFELNFQMDFMDATHYTVYQEHPIHLALREVAKELLERRPVTYDYVDMANPKDLSYRPE